MKRKSLKTLLKSGYKINYMCYDTNWYEWRINVITEKGDTWFFFKNLPNYIKFENLIHTNENDYENRITKISIFWE